MRYKNPHGAAARGGPLPQDQIWLDQGGSWWDHVPSDRYRLFTRLELALNRGWRANLSGRASSWVRTQVSSCLKETRQRASIKTGRDHWWQGAYGKLWARLSTRARFRPWSYRGGRYQTEPDVPKLGNLWYRFRDKWGEARWKAINRPVVLALPWNGPRLDH